MSEQRTQLEQHACVVIDDVVVVLADELPPAEAEALREHVLAGDIEDVARMPGIVAVARVAERGPAGVAHCTEVREPVRASVPAKRLITGPPPASGAEPTPPVPKPPVPQADIDTVTQSVTVTSTGSVTDDVATADTITHTGTATTDTITRSDTADDDLLTADTLTAAAPAAVMTTPLPSEGPKVRSVLCAGGHVQRIGAPVCGVCGRDIAPGTEQLRPRPEFAVAVVPGGERVPLGRGAVFGRRPRSSRMQGVKVPHLVTLESPGEDVSRSHLEIRLEDWSVLAIDLGSTNGTMLLREGREPMRLRAGVATIVEFGDRLDLGGEVQISVAEQ